MVKKKDKPATNKYGRIDYGKRKMALSIPRGCSRFYFNEEGDMVTKTNQRV